MSRSPSERQSIASRVRLRPSGAVVLRSGEDSRPWEKVGCAVLRIPKAASERDHQVVTALAMTASDRLASGDSFDFALCRIAAGRDVIAADLEMLGIYMDRKAVARSLARLVKWGVLRRVDQLDRWIDRTSGQSVVKTGAFVYELAITLRQVGTLALKAIWKVSSHTSATVGDSRSKKWLTACLKWAQNRAHEGNRNATGYVLARRCIDAGLTEVQAEVWLIRYRESVAGLGHCYTARECLRTLESAYRHHAPEASRNRPRGLRVSTY